MGQPYTIRHGSWSPDLQDVAVQVPYQFSAVEIPSADVLNCYYQDGAFRCLPGPQAIGPAASEAILNALTYYDEVGNQEVVFAASDDAIYTLIDGAWIPVPFVVSTIVQAPSFTVTSYMGGAIGPNQSGPFKATFTLGTTIAHGQIYNGTLSAASVASTYIGFADGYPFSTDTGGALTPPTDINGNKIIAMNSYGGGRSGEYLFELAYTGTLSQSYFSSIVFNSLGVALDSSGAAFSQASGTTLWRWSQALTPVVNLAAGQNYAVSINP